MNPIENQPVKEAVKEAARLVLFAAVAAGVSALLEYLGAFDSNNIVIAVSTLFLRSVDKYLHKSDVQVNGLAPF